jgi:hypothetical protein
MHSPWVLLSQLGHAALGHRPVGAGLDAGDETALLDDQFAVNRAGKAVGHRAGI